MFNVCAKCGSYHVDKIVDSKEALAICPDCGHAHKFKQLPLFVITGASGTGKSTICMGLVDIMSEVVVMEGDILWMEEFNKPGNAYMELWLRLCKNISQGGRPVVLCSTIVPSSFENCIERRYFSQIHYLVLTCNDEVLVKRLKDRPSWRNSGSDEFVKANVDYNNWFINNAEKGTPNFSLLDTSNDSFETTIEKIQKWILERM